MFLAREEQEEPAHEFQTNTDLSDCCRIAGPCADGRGVGRGPGFQNPFKWYNLSAPNTTVNFTNPATFGKVSTSTSDEGTTANAGGQGLMNITLSFRF